MVYSVPLALLPREVALKCKLPKLHLPRPYCSRANYRKFRTVILRLGDGNRGKLKKHLAWGIVSSFEGFRHVQSDSWDMREFPQIRGTVFWGPYNIRILLCRVPYSGPLFSETPNAARIRHVVSAVIRTGIYSKIYSFQGLMGTQKPAQNYP